MGSFKNKSALAFVKTRSQEFILPQVHSLDDVPTVVKYPADIFRVHSARKMRVTVMASVSACRADPLLESKRITLEMKNANAANVAVISHNSNFKTV